MRRALSESDIAAAVQQLSDGILQKNPDSDFVLVGLRSRGDEVAERILAQLTAQGLNVEMGVLDISLYRDDLAHLSSNPKLQGSDIPFTVDGAKIILVDDVLFTGRTVRSAIDALMDYGRPSKIELAVLIDRGHRELPFAPDYVGITLDTQRMDYVDVKLKGSDGLDSVEVTENQD
ncbi:bifunctional pyr operon transcriptional regulator/uracil phosphoribosyltransferase PyrR [Verrucomicrobiaceae bacterium 5K15]|uniref:Bifunctional protein PyrR n=1 Tax=Oceaniferula flava TaxID=2800421 RepID=A0AAE2V9U5_9BACT|nr:bifunctional pyr operon transcriptional regulator/uracil phosphoribosyltransferase PyrR [Oceaniferula flavus]MBK1855733.1 bifunctional pyr operon transcriptional regulator/uracil phosphoribosyltransferase PyrR [Oceaniferula flavus]MBM1137040.1 bifunctional pyr operon transcriptional regulator/uracil phosphoribosyltransferase PyrR [Oceaniferula flavus]